MYRSLKSRHEYRLEIHYSRHPPLCAPTDPHVSEVSVLHLYTSVMFSLSFSFSHQSLMKDEMIFFTSSIQSHPCLCIHRCKDGFSASLLVRIRCRLARENENRILPFGVIFLALLNSGLNAVGPRAVMGI